MFPKSLWEGIYQETEISVMQAIGHDLYAQHKRRQNGGVRVDCQLIMKTIYSDHNDSSHEADSSNVCDSCNAIYTVW